MQTLHDLSAAHDSGRRPAPPTLIVIHDTEGSRSWFPRQPSAEGVARYFANPPSRDVGSAHYVVDDSEVWRCVDDMTIAWHARGFNTIGLGLEICGWKDWTRAQWLDHIPTLDAAAGIHAIWNLKYGIPLTWSTVSGFHSHAGLPGNDHTDPGPNFPWDYYIDRVRSLVEPEDGDFYFEALPYDQGGVGPKILGQKAGYASWRERDEHLEDIRKANPDLLVSRFGGDDGRFYIFGWGNPLGRDWYRSIGFSTAAKRNTELQKRRRKLPADADALRSYRGKENSLWPWPRQGL